MKNATFKNKLTQPLLWTKNAAITWCVYQMWFLIIFRRYCHSNFNIQSAVKPKIEKTPDKIKNRIPCPYCPQKYLSNGDLNRHKNKIHLGIKDFQCDFNKCNKTFASRGELKQHNYHHFPRVVLNLENRISARYWDNLNFRATLANVRLAINRGQQIAGLRKWRENSNCPNIVQRSSFQYLRQL